MLVGILLGDDLTRRRVVAHLQAAGHETLVVRTGREAMAAFGPASAVTLVALDTRLPDAEGRDVCSSLRANGQDAPVVFVARDADVRTRVAALRAGADDFVVVPYEPEELVARVEAAGRRPRWPRDPDDVDTDFALDPARHSVRTRAGERLLTPTEFRILAAITARRSEITRREELVRIAWPAETWVSPNNIDSFLRRIRLKLEALASPVRIQTVRGIGFRVSEDPPASVTMTP